MHGQQNIKKITFKMFCVKMQQTTEHVIRVQRREVMILVDYFFFHNYDSRSL